MINPTGLKAMPTYNSAIHKIHKKPFLCKKALFSKDNSPFITQTEQLLIKIHTKTVTKSKSKSKRVKKRTNKRRRSNKIKNQIPFSVAFFHEQRVFIKH